MSYIIECRDAIWIGRRDATTVISGKFFNISTSAKDAFAIGTTDEDDGFDGWIVQSILERGLEELTDGGAECIDGVGFAGWGAGGYGDYGHVCGGVGGSHDGQDWNVSG